MQEPSRNELRPRSEDPESIASGGLRSARRTRASWHKVLLLAAVAAAAGVGYAQFGDALTLENLAARESELRQFQQAHEIMVVAMGFSLYVVVAALSLPGAAALTLLSGWVFGVGAGLVLASCASTAGAVLAFLLSRYFFREWIQERFGDRLKRFDDALEREGAFYLFTLRLIPAVPFFVINLVMGLTPIKARTFWWVSQLGMLPGTAVYVYAGSSVPALQTLAEQGLKGILSPNLIAAFVLIGIFPIAVKRIIGKWKAHREKIVP